MLGAGDGEETMITINGAAYPLDTITPYNSEYGPFERRNRVKITYTRTRPGLSEFSWAGISISSG